MNTPRIAEHPADPMFMNRCAPRAMSGEALTTADLSVLFEAARVKLHVPDDFATMCMVALGKSGRREDLPEKQQAREQPNDRILAEKFTFAGRMP